MAGYDAEVRINTKVDSSQMISLENRITKTTEKIDELTQKLNNMRNAKVPTEEFKAVEEQISKSQVALNKLTERMEKFTEMGKSTKASAFKSMQYDAEQLRQTIEYAQGEKQALEESGGAYTTGSNSADYAKVNSQLQQERGNLDALIAKHNELMAKQNQTGTNAVTNVNKASKAVSTGSNLVESFSKRVWGLAKRVFVFSLITRAFRTMIEGLKAGIDNYVQYSSKANASMSQFKSACAELKNTMAVAFAPILNSIVPALATLVGWLTTAINALNQFIALMAGKSTYTKATQQNINYAKSLDKAGSSAKKASSNLAAFDEINVLSKDSSSGSGGGGELTGAKAFQEVPLDKTSAMAKAVEALKQEAKELKAIFDKGFWDGFNNGGQIFQDLLGHLAHLKEVLASIWNDPAVAAAREAWLNSFIYMLGQIAGAGADIGITIADNIFGGLDEYFTQNSDRVKQWLINMFNIGTEINTMIGNFFSAFAYVFEAFASQAGIQMTANLIGIFVDAFMGITELAGKFARDIINIITKPFIENKEAIRTALEGMLGVIGTVLGAVKDLVDGLMDQLNAFYDAHLKPLFDAIATGLTEIVGTFMSVLNSTVIPILQQIADMLAPFVSEYILPLSQAIFDFIGNVVDLLTMLWTTVLVPFIDWIIANILPVVTPIFAALTSMIMAFLTAATTVVTAILQVLNALITFLKVGFTKGWDEAWTGLEESLVKIWDMMIQKIKDSVDKIGQFVEDMVNKAIDGINKIIEGFNSIAHIQMPEWLGGKSVGITIPTIPHLASGAVIEGGSPFLAMLGDQSAGQTNVEAPLDTIVQAMREALGNGGSGNMNITMEMDGETLARVSMPYFSAESNRIGLNLGGAT